MDFWQSYHQDLIKMIRDEQQANNIILVEGTSWGQDGGDWNLNTNINPAKSAIISRGQNLINFNNKTYSNIVFSMHIYEMWNGSESRLLDYFAQVKAKNLPLIVGEYGSRNNDSSLEGTQNMFIILSKAGFSDIGRIVWIWAGGDENNLAQNSQWGTWNEAPLPGNGINMANGNGHGNLIDK